MMNIIVITVIAATLVRHFEREQIIMILGFSFKASENRIIIMMIIIVVVIRTIISGLMSVSLFVCYIVVI